MQNIVKAASGLVVAFLIITVATFFSPSHGVASEQQKGPVLVGGKSFVPNDESTINMDSDGSDDNPLAIPCYTDCVVSINIDWFRDGFGQIVALNSAGCDDTWSNGDWTNWGGLCLLTSATNCRSGYGGSLWTCSFHYVPTNNITIGHVTLYCQNAGTNGCTNAFIPIVMIGGSSSVSFWIYPDCTSNCCGVNICTTYSCPICP